MKIAFVGGGNMARSLIGGLIETGHAASSIWVSDPLDDTLQKLAADYQLNTSSSNHAVVSAADVVLLSVKPQQLEEVVRALGAELAGKLCISIAAGPRCDDIQRWAGTELSLVRCMPNTPALVQQGATALYAGPTVSTAERDIAESVLAAVGITAWLDSESQMDAITALSGSGPAYFFLLVEEMIRAGIELGLPEEVARRFAAQTANGAAQMVAGSDVAPAILRQNVTSPGGTTAAALESFAQDDFGAVVNRALQAANDRSRQLGDLLGGQ